MSRLNFADCFGVWNHNLSDYFTVSLPSLGFVTRLGCKILWMVQHRHILFSNCGFVKRWWPTNNWGKAGTVILPGLSDFWTPVAYFYGINRIGCRGKHKLPGSKSLTSRASSSFLLSQVDEPTNSQWLFYIGSENQVKCIHFPFLNISLKCSLSTAKTALNAKMMNSLK